MVRMENVSKVYPSGQKAVDSVTLSIPKGETLVLVGPSGCGKTTTLKMINQLIKHTEGKIYVGGQDVSTVNPVQLRRQIGYVIQQIGLLPHLNIMNNITFVLQITGYPKSELLSRAEEMLKVVGLPASYLTRHPRQLSGGEQQRVGVARALAADPEIILMDEPFGALDPITREQLQKEMIDLQSKLHKTIVFVTHDIQEAFKVGSRVGVMRQGRLVKVARPMDLVINEEDEFIKNFVGTKGVLDALELVTVAEAMEEGCPLLSLGQSLEAAVISLGDWDYALVMNERKSCVGKVSRSRLLEGSRRGVVEVEMLEETGPVVPVDYTMKRAVELMVLTGWSWLPVVDKGEVLRGIVAIESCSKIMQAGCQG
ncbi:hypothetical protein SY88_10935 [Clostridiales bacterium PH28_bin88]|nr:hypothetical protein SY88_10935 [Clostridiales bacterium PH28_bin88]